MKASARSSSTSTVGSVLLGDHPPQPSEQPAGFPDFTRSTPFVAGPANGETPILGQREEVTGSWDPYHYPWSGVVAKTPRRSGALPPRESDSPLSRLAVLLLAALAISRHQVGDADHGNHREHQGKRPISLDSTHSYQHG